METKFRKSPPVCLFISIGRLLTGKLKLTKLYVKNTVKMEDGQEYTIFRHIAVSSVKDTKQVVTFLVRFKFARLSHNANRFASIIPMLLITGFPGFQIKMYAVNKENGHWLGMYQWKSLEYLEEYKKSLVYRVMNKRAISGTIESVQFENKLLDSFIKENTGNEQHDGTSAG